MSSSWIFALFLRLILLFGGICCASWILSTMFVAPYRALTRDDIVSIRQQSQRTSDEKVCETISDLGLRRRGCRAGARHRQRLQAARNVMSSVNAAHRVGAIPVIIGNRRPPRLTSSGPGSCRTTREESPARHQRKQRKHERIITPVHRSTGSHEHDNTVPSLYVFNAAALTKPHAIEQLTAELSGYNIDVA